MSETKYFKAFITSFSGGKLSVQTNTGDYLVIELGPAQMVSAHRDIGKEIEAIGEVVIA